MTKKDEKHSEEIKDTEIIEEIPNEEKSELEKLKQKLEETESGHKRALADYQNLQKRVEDTRRDLVLGANRELLLRILSVLDTLVLANEHTENEGLKVSIAQFLDVLKTEGVTKIETKDQEFNPALMEAVTTSEGAEGKVLKELKTGYLLNDKLLRPAQVVVGKGKI